MAALSELQLDHLTRRLETAGVTDIRPLSGGASSLTFAGVMQRERPVVIKVAPPGFEPILHRDVLRQSRVIRALRPTPVPVPEVLWEDAGEPPAVPPLFVMSFLDGTSLEPLFDIDGDGTDSGVVAERLRNAARAMAALHRVSPSTIGLGEEPVIGLADEIERWVRLLETVDRAMVPEWPDVAVALRASAPEAVRPAVVHGDFRLGNLLASGHRVTGVVDWEIWSIGDPRLDVGWFLANANPDTYLRRTAYHGLTPPPDELARIYADALGYEVPELDWFQGLACFKSAATWSLIVKHNRRRTQPSAELEAMADALPRLLQRAAHYVGG